MKLKLSSVLFGVALGAGLIAATGCNTNAGRKARDFLYTPQVAEQHVPPTMTTNLILVTNVVTATITNATGEVTNQETIEVTPVERIEFKPGYSITVTNGWQKNEAVFTAAETTLGFIPGWGTIAATALAGLGTAGATFLSKKKSDSKAEAFRVGAVSTITGIDEFRRGLQTTEQGRALDAELTRMLERSHVDYGSLTLIKELLDEHTGYTSEQGKVAELLAPKA